MAETDRAPRHPATQAAQALGRVDPRTRAIVPGIEPATTFLRDPDGGYVSGRIYGRADNPTYEPAEALLSELERGAASLLFASGTAAAMAVFQALDPGDHAVIPRAMYWALRAWVARAGPAAGASRSSWSTRRDLDALAAAMRPGRTRLVWLETPANPFWEISDIAAVPPRSRTGPGRGSRSIPTVATPVLTQPARAWAPISSCTRRPST